MCALQLSAAERDRRAHRREQNKQAAARCRQRREETIQRLTGVGLRLLYTVLSI